MSSSGQAEDEVRRERLADERERVQKQLLVESAPAMISDHPFEPKGEWYSTCKTCDMAEAAHMTSINPKAPRRDK